MHGRVQIAVENYNWLQLRFNQKKSVPINIPAVCLVI